MSITVSEDILLVIGTNTSTDTVSGALIVSGGVGIAENINVGNDCNINNQLTLGIGGSSYSFPVTKGTDNQVLTLSTTGSLVFSDNSGTINNATNVGYTSGGALGVFKQLTGDTLEFYQLDVGSNKLSLALNTTNGVLDFDVIEGNIIHQNLNGAGTNTHAQIDSHISNTSNPHNVLATQITDFDQEVSNNPDVSRNTEYINANLNDNILLSGGASWDSGLTFNVTACTYIIEQVLYTSAAGQVTLDASDVTNPRIDVIVVNTSGAIDKVTGVAAPSPSKPEINNETQVEVTFVTINAGQTIPDGLVVEDVYLENGGSGGGEWDVTEDTGGSRIVLNSTNDPSQGTTSIEGTSVVANDTITFTETAIFDASTISLLEFSIKSKATWPSTKKIQIALYNGNSRNGSSISFNDGFNGFDSSNTTTYQTISISLGLFGLQDSNVDNIKFDIKGSGGSIGFFIDRVRLQTGINVPSNPAGETNTASNVGDTGIGVFKQKIGTNLEFYQLDTGSNKLSLALNTTNGVLDFDIIEGNIDINNLLGAPTGTIVGDTDIQTMTNKTFDDATTFFQDDINNTKKLQFQLSGITAGTTKILTIPDESTTIAGTDATQTLTNKIIDSTTNTVMAGKLQTSAGAVTVSSAAAPTSGQFLVATSGTSATWQSSEASRVSYILKTNEIRASNTTYETVANITWDNSRYSTYADGTVIFEAVIVDRNLDIKLRDVTNATDLGSLLGVSSSGFYTIAVTNPPSDARMEIQVQKSAVGGSNPKVFGIGLEYNTNAIQIASTTTYDRIEITSATYTILESDDIIGVTYTITGAVTVTLPQISGLADDKKKKFVIVDEGGNASNNNITIATTGGDTVNGNSNYVINGSYTSISVYSDTVSNWVIY